MKATSKKTHVSALVLLFAVTGLMAQAVFAYKTYLLEENYYAIVCTDGQIFSYSGSSSGLSTVGPALCEGHGGIVAGGGGGVTATKAPRDVVNAMKSCKGGKGKRVSSTAIQCPGKVRAAQDHNSARSNKTSSK